MARNGQETHESYASWAARMIEDVRELERVAQHSALTDYHADPTVCGRCGHYVMPNGRCLGCETEGMRDR